MLAIPAPLLRYIASGETKIHGNSYTCLLLFVVNVAFRKVNVANVHQ